MVLSRALLPLARVVQTPVLPTHVSVDPSGQPWIRAKGRVWRRVQGQWEAAQYDVGIRRGALYTTRPFAEPLSCKG